MSNIKPGDLVMVVGKIFTVRYIDNHSCGACEICGKVDTFIGVDYEPMGNGNAGYEIERLIKIDPPPISEETKENLGLYEPA